MNLRLLGAFAALSLLAACATPATTGNSAGNGGSATTSGGPTPGSQEDLVANVGDRVFYDFNQCDDRGTEEYNLALGQRRANSARDYLVAKGVSSGRITTISYGKDRPTALGDSEDSWRQNRNAITSVK